MNIHFFERQLVPNRISIEKVFSVVKSELEKRNFKIAVFTNPFPLSKMLQAMWFFKKHQGDISHITGDIHWACVFLNRKTTVLTIHDIVGIENYNTGWKKKLYLLIWLYLPIWKLKYITVISQKTKNELLEYYPSAASKIRVINNPLTFNIFRREIFDKTISEFKILIVGTRDNKNVERILTATKNIVCSITIVGKTSETQNKLIRESAATIKKNDFVTDEALEQLYREADLLCFPSLYEGFGMPVIEAHAAGCAVITSSIEPMLSVGADAALFVDPLSTKEIEEKILLLINDLDLRRKLVEKGYKNAELYSPEAVTEQYIKLYKEIEDDAGIIA